MSKPDKHEMIQRSYTLSEIDRMRAGIRNANLNTKPSVTIVCSNRGVGYVDQNSLAALRAWESECEEQLRTVILGGVDPAEFPDAIEPDEH